MVKKIKVNGSNLGLICKIGMSDTIIQGLNILKGNSQEKIHGQWESITFQNIPIMKYHTI